MRGLSYLQLYLGYRTDFGVYFHFIEIADPNYDIVNTATVMVHLQIQGHELFCGNLHISGCTRTIGKISVSTHYRGRGSQLWCNQYCNSSGLPSISRSRAILHDLLYFRLYSRYRKDLGILFHIIEVANPNYDIINTATITIDLQFSRSLAILRDLLYLRLYSNYQEDLGVYFHVIDVMDDAEKTQRDII